MTTATKAKASKTRSLTELIDTLRVAHEQKGETPTSLDADAKKYGLYGKYVYRNEFGSWNNAIRAAGLEVNEWNPRQTRQPKEDANRLSMLEYVERQIREEEGHANFLRQVMNNYDEYEGRIV